MLSVGSKASARFDLDAVPAADESIDAHLVAVLVQQLDREGVDHRQLRRCGRPDTGPQPGACGQPVGVDERRDRLGDPRRRVRQQVRGTRVRVVRDGSRDELDDHDPARPRRRPAAVPPGRARRPRSARRRLRAARAAAPAARRATRCPTPPRLPRRSGPGREAGRPPPATPPRPTDAAGTRPCCRSRRGRRGGRRGPLVRRAATSTARAARPAARRSAGRTSASAARRRARRRRAAAASATCRTLTVAPSRRSRCGAPCGGRGQRLRGAASRMGCAEARRARRASRRNAASIDRVDRRHAVRGDVPGHGQDRLRWRSRNGSSTTSASTRPRWPSTVHSTSSREPTRS